MTWTLSVTVYMAACHISKHAAIRKKKLSNAFLDSDPAAQGRTA